MKICPAKQINGKISLPGDKSISHRAAMIAAMSTGETRIDNFATSADCSSTIACLAALGVNIRRDGHTVSISGVGKNGFRQPPAPLDCGNSGTTMRLLAGILAGQTFDSTLTGDESLRTRPMKRIIEPLAKIGVIVKSDEGRAPLDIPGRFPLTAIDYVPPIASAQIKSCTLLAGLNANGITSVTEAVQTRDHTERMLRWFGVAVTESESVNGTRISVSGDAALSANDLVIPGDISSAAFFMVAAACLPGSDITLPNIGINPSRRAVFDVLNDLGADFEITGSTENCNEPVASIHIRGSKRSAAKRSTPVLRGDVIANLIDEIPIIAVFATQLESGLEIRDAAELRVKESDRISAIVKNLELMGADVTEFPDGFRVGRSMLKGAGLDSYGDHRIAMAFAVAGLLAKGQTEIAGAECANISFPGFFETLASVVK